MSIFLDRIDAAPLANANFPFDFNQWVSVMIDTLNESLREIQDALNSPGVSYTAAQITQFQTDGILSDGVVLYDTTNNVYVGRKSGVLVSFTTAAYP